ncbi:MAG TPA: class II glutamine amidotransferase [Solirubrobacteraceae bacterium]|jgi:glutamine amidotransferase
MCRLFGMSAGEQRARATFWLLDAPDSLAAQSHREPDGTGLGWFDEHGAAQLRKQPLAAYGDADFAHEAREISSSTFVAHVRFASTGSLTLLNTHPFEQRERLFAHNGVIEDLDVLDAQLGDARELVRGETDSERLFALITREIERHEGDVETGIASACQWVAANLPLLAINLVLITERDMWALRYPETHELHILERDPGSTLEHTSSLGTRVRSEHGASQRLVVIASERMDDDPRWRPLASGELVHVDRELRVSSRRILEGPPARALTLADLGARARASQARATQGATGTSAS